MSATLSSLAEVTTPVAIVVIDDRERITLANAEAHALFGYEPDALLGASVEMLVPERFRVENAAYRALYRQAPTSRTMGPGTDLFGLRKDGSEVSLEIGLSPLHTLHGAFVLVAMIEVSQKTHTAPRDDAHIAQLDALNATLHSVEDTLHTSERHARRQAERLVALWKIANNPTLRGPDLMVAMLRQAAASIRLKQRFRGVLGRIVGSDVLVVAVGVDPTDDDPRAQLLQVGGKTPLDRTLIPRGGRTQAWDDLATMDDPPGGIARHGWRSAISTQFSAGDTGYSLTFASTEPTLTPFSPEDFAYLEVLAAAFAHQLQVNQLEESLRDEEERSRQHAERLEGLWQIVNNSGLRDEAMWLAMLGQATTSIRRGQPFRGILWRIDGANLILEAMVESHDGPERLPFFAFPIRVGSAIPLAESIIGQMLGEGPVTRSWDDIQVTPYDNSLSKQQDTHAFIITSLTAGGAHWVLSFSSREKPAKPLGPQEHRYIEVLASFFANYLQQRWQFDRIQYQQSHDVLTGLLSRSQFRSQARTASGTATGYAVILVDVDAFSEINATYGNMTGDAILVEIGHALQQRAGAHEFVGRVGGDVFAIYVDNAASSGIALERARDFSERFRRGFSTGDGDGRGFIACTASLGIATCPAAGAGIDDVLSHANAALVAAKARGPGSTVLYEP